MTEFKVGDRVRALPPVDGEWQSIGAYAGMLGIDLADATGVVIDRDFAGPRVAFDGFFNPINQANDFSAFDSELELIEAA